MAGVNQIITVTFVSGGETLTTRKEKSVGAVHRISEEIPAVTTDLSMPLTINAAKIESIMMKCTGTDIKVETNNGGTPIDTFNLKTNGTPVVWDKDSGAPSPFTANVTGLFVTNIHATLAGTIEIIIGYDPS